jgi:hypothetical protein
MRLAAVASLSRTGLAQRGMAAAPKKGGAAKPKKDAGGGGSAAAGPGDFKIDEMYPELKLGELTAADVPAWAARVYSEVFEQPKLADRPPPLPGQEDRKSFKVLRRAKIKENNERRGLGMK